MNLVFSGLEQPVSMEPGRVTVLEVQNQRLFTRLCQSLLTEAGEEGAEPYSLWEGEDKLSPKGRFLIVANPLELPWKHRSLSGALLRTMERLYLEDDEMRLRLDSMAAGLSARASILAHQLHGVYGFQVEWKLTDFLKAFGFGVEVDEDTPLLDKLIQFIDFVVDAGVKETILFINLKTFLLENELQEFARHVFFQKTRVLLLEQQAGDYICFNESKYVVDQHFLEYEKSFWSESPSSSQGRFCPIGFGAVAF